MLCAKHVYREIYVTMLPLNKSHAVKQLFRCSTLRQTKAETGQGGQTEADPNLPVPIETRLA